MQRHTLCHSLTLTHSLTHSTHALTQPRAADTACSVTSTSSNTSLPSTTFFSPAIPASASALLTALRRGSLAPTAPADERSAAETAARARRSSSARDATIGLQAAGTRAAISEMRSKPRLARIRAGESSESRAWRTHAAHAARCAAPTVTPALCTGRACERWQHAGQAAQKQQQREQQAAAGRRNVPTSGRTPAPRRVSCAPRLPPTASDRLSHVLPGPLQPSAAAQRYRAVPVPP